jgi:Calx-beta domain/Domain of unknown function DUF11
MSFDRDPSTPPRHRRGRRIVGPAILLAAAALFAGASGAATDEGADIALVNLSMERAAVGSAYTFAYEIDNRGPSPATGVELTADLHGSFSFDSVVSDQGRCDYAGPLREVTCAVGTVPEDGSVRIEIVVTPSGQLDSVASISSTLGEDPDSTNNGSTFAPSVLPEGSADLWVYPNSGLGDEGVDDGGYAIVGRPYGYAIDVVNYGPAVAEDVVLTVGLPDGVDLESADASCTPLEDDAGLVVTCALGRLETSKTVEVTAIPQPGTAGRTVRTEVSVDGSGLDPGPANNTSGNILSIVAGLSAPAAKGGEGGRVLRVPVSLSDAVSDVVTVDYATVGGKAKAGVDYRSTSGTLTFQPGETRRTISIPIVQDRITEPSEAFGLRLANVNLTGSGTSATWGIPTAGIVNDRVTLTILDDDPKIHVTNARVVEGDSGRHRARLRVVLSAPSPEQVTAQLKGVSRSARAGADFVGDTMSVRFRPGQRTQTVGFWIKADRQQERNEAFVAKLSRVRGAVVADATGVVRIVDDD